MSQLSLCTQLSVQLASSQILHTSGVSQSWQGFTVAWSYDYGSALWPRHRDSTCLTLNLSIFVFLVLLVNTRMRQTPACVICIYSLHYCCLSQSCPHVPTHNWPYPLLLCPPQLTDFLHSNLPSLALPELSTPCCGTDLKPSAADHLHNACNGSHLSQHQLSQILGFGDAAFSLQVTLGTRDPLCRPLGCPINS